MCIRHFQRWCALALVATALICVSAPASLAQVDPVFRPGEDSASPTSQSVSLTRDLFIQLTLVDDATRVASSLTQLLRRAGEVCTSVTDFQVIYQQSNEQRVKIKCPGRPHFGLIINQGGRVLVFGGDGMVGDFNPGDGLIHAVSGTVRPQSVDRGASRDRSGPDLGESGNLPGLLQGDDPTKIPTWLVFLVIINGFIVLALILSFFWFMRAKTQAPKPQKPVKTGMTSAEKDRLVIDSREILPDVYHHPEGFFIARGKRGKRRLFGNLFFALLYREYGFKFREIH